MSPAPGCFYISETSSLWVIFNVWFWNRILKIDTLLPPLPLQKCHRGLTTWLSGQPPGTKSCLAWNKLPHFPISVQPTHPLSYSRSWVRPNLKILHFQDFQLKKKHWSDIHFDLRYLSYAYHVHLRHSLNEKVQPVLQLMWGAQLTMYKR